MLEETKTEERYSIRRVAGSREDYKSDIKGKKCNENKTKISLTKENPTKESFQVRNRNL